MKKTIMIQSLLFIGIGLMIGLPHSVLGASLYDISVNTMTGRTVQMSQYKGKVILIVNTASKCGFTPQLAELESLYKSYQEKGLVILAFPSNDFKQDPEENTKIQQFASDTYGVTFPLFEKIKITGKDKHPLYEHLTKAKPGLLMSEVTWNFEKFLIDRDGNVVERFGSTSSPLKSIKKNIEKLL